MIAPSVFLNSSRLFSSPQWYKNSLQDLRSGECMDVFKTNPYPMWMWPCVLNPSSAQRRKLLQSVDNQQWEFVNGQLQASGYIVPGQSTYWCLDGATLQLAPCHETAPPASMVWTYNNSTKWIQNGKGSCLSSTRPSSPNPANTNVVLALRAGEDDFGGLSLVSLS